MAHILIVQVDHIIFCREPMLTVSVLNSTTRPMAAICVLLHTNVIGMIFVIYIHYMGIAGMRR